MNKYEPVIGLEIHLETKTRSKMFSSAPVTYNCSPNSEVVSLDLGEPGSLPTVNKEAVSKALQMCSALHMQIDPVVRFDRKNYFYADLPKGYQITQNEFPIGRNGYVLIHSESGEPITIALERLHMEEDTAKQIHFADYTLLDFNRAGNPLVEIVTKPVIRTAFEAMKYVEKIRMIAQYLEISDGKMEEGSLRCDVNISIRPTGETKLGTKVEIKNLNSIANVGKAIEFEIERQTQALESGEIILQETRRFDENTRSTLVMRLKTDAVDYKYFRECNILPISLTDRFIIDSIADSKETPDKKYLRYTSGFGLSHLEAIKILENRELSLYFDALATHTDQYLSASNFLKGEVNAFLNANELSYDQLPITIQDLAYIVDILGKGLINNKTAREFFNEVIQTGANPFVLYEQSVAQAMSDDELSLIITTILNENEQSILDYKSGKDRAFGFLIGQIMKRTAGKANPQKTNQILREMLNK